MSYRTFLLTVKLGDDAILFFPSSSTPLIGVDAGMTLTTYDQEILIRFVAEVVVALMVDTNPIVLAMRTTGFADPSALTQNLVSTLLPG